MSDQAFDHSEALESYLPRARARPCIRRGLLNLTIADHEWGQSLCERGIVRGRLGNLSSLAEHAWWFAGFRFPDYLVSVQLSDPKFWAGSAAKAVGLYMLNMV